ncbi:MAG: hypothetical protein ACTSU8_01070 [Alphaproteobacteria bacterium]
MKKVLFAISLVGIGILASEIGHHLLARPIKIEMGDAALTMGKGSYPSDYGFSDSVYLVMDKETIKDDATIVFRETGNARAEIGIVGDNDIHFKTVTGTYNNEIFVDRFLIRSTGEVDAVGKIFRQFATSGTPTIVIGDSNGESAGAGLELSYNFDKKVSGISSISRDISYQPLSFSAESYAFHTGLVDIEKSPAVQILSEGTLKVFGGLQIATNATYSGGTFSQGSLYRDPGHGFVMASISGSKNDFLLTTTEGGNVMRIPTGTNDVEFSGDLKTSGVAGIGTFTVATLPDPVIGGMIFVSDGAGGGPVLAFSDGANWLRSDTRAIVSR